MNDQQIHAFLLRFLEAFECRIEASTAYSLTCKLSPEADKCLISRPYYWKFIEQNGIEPETLTCTLIFHPQGASEEHSHHAKNSGIATQEASPIGHARIIQDDVTWGSRKLQQLFDIVRAKGRFVQMFENNRTTDHTPLLQCELDTWLGINYKVEFMSDRKRSELHSFAIQLQTKEICEHFYTTLQAKSLSPKLPCGLRLQLPTLSIEEGAQALAAKLGDKIIAYEAMWATEAHHRLQEELSQVNDYYRGILQSAIPEQIQKVEALHRQRQDELTWQIQPRIVISVINAGLFHLHKNHIHELKRTNIFNS